MMHNTDVEKREREREREEDTERWILQTRLFLDGERGETEAWAVEWRRREMTRVGEEGKGGAGAGQ